MKRFGYLLFFLLVVYFIFLIRQDIMDNLELKRTRVQLSASIRQERSLHQRLTRRLQALRSDEYLERLARTRLGLVKRGETAYKVVK
jgi:cell division protein FtsB